MVTFRSGRLHDAAGSDDVKFTRFPRLGKLDPSSKNAGDRPARRPTSEEVALALLAAGTDPGGLNRDGWSFRNYVMASRWYGGHAGSTRTEVSSPRRVEGANCCRVATKRIVRVMQLVR